MCDNNTAKHVVNELKSARESVRSWVEGYFFTSGSLYDNSFVLSEGRALRLRPINSSSKAAALAAILDRVPPPNTTTQLTNRWNQLEYRLVHGGNRQMMGLLLTTLPSCGNKFTRDPRKSCMTAPLLGVDGTRFPFDC